MKINLREMALGLGVLSIALGTGCETNRANAEPADGVQVFTNATPTPTAIAPVAPTAPIGVAAATVAEPPANPNPNATPAPPSTSAGTAVTATVPNPAQPTNAPIVQPAIVPEQMNLSPALAQVVKLIQAGVSSDVVMTYVTNSTDLFNIGSKEILYLHDLGAPSPIITALIHKDSSPEFQAKRQALASTQPLPAGVALNTPATNIYPTSAPPPADPPEPTPVAPPNSVQTVTAPLTPVAEEEPATVTYFESELSPYGSWVYVNGYGRCWRPTVSVWNGDWRPYVDSGRWLWTDSGWYWYSDYSWGWAPFHYGRWFCPPGIGWVWYPDTVWGPSWVSWRHSQSYCGWAPLPPSAHWVHGHGFFHHSVSVGIGFEFGLGHSDYVFVGYDRFCDRRPSAYLLAGHHAHTAWGETRVANNYIFKNNTIVNQGAGVESVSSITRGNVRKVALRDTPNSRDVSGRREHLDADGQNLAITRPSANVLAGRVPVSSSPVRPSNGSRFAAGTTPNPSANQVTRGTDVDTRPTGTVSPRNSSTTPSSTTPNDQPITRPTTVTRGNGVSGHASTTPPNSRETVRPFTRPGTTPNNGQNSQVTRPFTSTRPPSRESTIVAGGEYTSSATSTTPTTPPGATRSAPAVTGSGSTITRPPGSSPSTGPAITRPSGSSPGIGSTITRPSGSSPSAGSTITRSPGSSPGTRSTAPAITTSPSAPRESIRNTPSAPAVTRPSAPSAPSSRPSSPAPAQSRPSVSSPAPRAEVSRPSSTPSRVESGRSSGGGDGGGSSRSSGNSNSGGNSGGGGNRGGGGGRGRD